ncbi:unnamed protein product, partial [Ectocarpus fasciculatus]
HVNVGKLSFSTQDRLTTHIQRHTNKNPFSCDFVGCDRSFPSPSTLTRHKKTH